MFALITNTLLEASSAFLHTPLMFLIGFVGYLALKGYKSADQADHIKALKYQLHTSKLELASNELTLDALALEKAELKDELREVTRHKDRYRRQLVESHERERELEKKVIELEDEYCTLESAKENLELALLEEKTKEANYTIDLESLSILLDEAMMSRISSLAYDVADEIQRDLEEMITKE